MAKELTWSFYKVWNKSIEARPQREVKPRDVVWASELGGSVLDVWLKMQGQEPTNPPNPRSLRKFEAGNIWEAIVKYVLQRAGILLAAQEWLKYEYDGCVPVTGRLDFFAGGTPDYDKALASIREEFGWLPSSIQRATEAIIAHLKESFPSGLKNIILEIKSTSSFMFEAYEKGKASFNHKLQLYHYLKAKGIEEGHICYICRDDARMVEVGVFNPSPIEEHYHGWIENLSGYYYTDTQPPLEPPIVFDEALGRFSVNYKVSYSQYLTMLYGFKNQKEVEEKYKPLVERWNRVLGRMREGKTMTDNNKQAIEEMRQYGFEIYEGMYEEEASEG